MFKPLENQNQRFTSSYPAFHPRFIRRTASALRSWLLTSGATPICHCKPFSYKACSGRYKITCRVQNPNLPRAGRGGAAHGGAAGRGGVGRIRAELNADGSVRPGDNRPVCLLGHRRQLLCMILWKHEQTKSYVNRWVNKNVRLTTGFIRGLSAGRWPLFVLGC